MTHSLAQEAGLTCRACGKPFTSQLWLVVDAIERPDLLEKARRGTLHAIPCPLERANQAVKVAVGELRASKPREPREKADTSPQMAVEQPGNIPSVEAHETASSPPINPTVATPNLGPE